ncbi:MAG: ABC transporter permease subunit [Peptococcaceae bacterium]|nr:ABC transporter permease subunit [Peptococcaceae bacterium]
MWTIAKMTFQEILYKKIFLIALLMTLAYLLLYAIATHYAGSAYAEDMNRMQKAGKEFASMQQYVLGSQLLSTGLYFSNFITGLLAVLASAGSIAGSIENHQIDPVLTRPLSRSSMILGKFVGLGSIMTIYALSFFSLIILINKFLGGPFGLHLNFLSTIKAGVLFACISLTIIAPALCLSTSFSTLNSGIILIILYGMSFVGGFVEQLGNLINKTALINIGIISSLVFPADSLFRGMNYVLMSSNDDRFKLIDLANMGLFFGSTPPSNIMLFYCGFYTMVFLFLAVNTFKRRDI